jgi:ectoine hydroxylase-related dioxygenase (phytanoyl-CoA dioxygenase family)
MPWNTLEHLWKRTLNPAGISLSENPITWEKEIETLYRLGIGMEDAIRYLHFEKPDFETFKIWVIARKRETLPITTTLTEPVLSPENLAFWEENGYVVVKAAISKQDCNATQQAIWDFLGMRADKQESWYQTHPEQRGLMLNFSDHETLNRNRLSERIRGAYEQLYRTSKIHKTIDKVSFNPPETADFKFAGSLLHWDVSLKQPIPFALQGLLYLTDCGPEDGAFHCVPGFHNKIAGWMDDLQKEEQPREKAVSTLKPVPVLGHAGDFIIWHQALPHCATPNHGTLPRMVQYLTYIPDDYRPTSEWI